MSVGADRRALRLIKTVHTATWLSIEMAMIYLLYAGFAHRSDRRAAVAAAIMGAETTVFVANGFRCPLTQLVERRGAESGSVTDICLPDWFAHRIPAIQAPLLLLAVYAHRRNLVAQRDGVSPTVM
jgi:hypothetical protein